MSMGRVFVALMVLLYVPLVYGMKKNTLLCTYVMGGDINACEARLNSNPEELDKRFNTGGQNWTPLIFAASAGNEELCKFLINRGADVRLKDKDDKTAYDYAQENGLHGLLPLLKEAEKKHNEGLPTKLQTLSKKLGMLQKKLIKLPMRLQILKIRMKKNYYTHQYTRKLVWKNNWCWMDAVLQCFAAIPEFREKIDLLLESGKPTNPVIRKIFEELSKALDELHCKDKIDEPYAAEALYNAIIVENPHLKNQPSSPGTLLDPILKELNNQNFLIVELNSVGVIKNEAIPLHKNGPINPMGINQPDLIRLLCGLENGYPVAMSFEVKNGDGETATYDFVGMIFGAGHWSAATRIGNGGWYFYDDTPCERKEISAWNVSQIPDDGIMVPGIASSTYLGRPPAKYFFYVRRP